MNPADIADHAMVPPTNDVLNSTPDADPLKGQLTVGDVAMLAFAIMASLFALIVALAT